MDRETGLSADWRAQKAMYLAWGELVKVSILRSVSTKISPIDTNDFIKIPVTPRTKTDQSLLEKAFFRNKGYTAPYADIEDKVGVRFVVLTTQDIKVIEDAICDQHSWSITKARDFEEERNLHPLVFDYQSVHYIVRPRDNIKFDDADIEKDIPCEIQIRTLLQHAYCELTHDTIYKPSIVVEPDMKRAAAKSMALIEATDEYFVGLKNRISKLTAPAKQAKIDLDSLYASRIGTSSSDVRLTALLIDRYANFITSDFNAEVTDFLTNKSYIIDMIKERRTSTILYQQSAIFLVYFAIYSAPTTAKQNTPLAPEELEQFYSDLGVSFDA